MTLALPILAFAAGAWFALVCRALVAEHAQRRIARAAEEALTPEHLERLRDYIAALDLHERERVQGHKLHALK